MFVFCLGHLDGAAWSNIEARNKQIHTNTYLSTLKMAWILPETSRNFLESSINKTITLTATCEAVLVLGWIFTADEESREWCVRSLRQMQDNKSFFLLGPLYLLFFFQEQTAFPHSSMEKYLANLFVISGFVRT